MMTKDPWNGGAAPWLRSRVCVKFQTNRCFCHDHITAAEFSGNPLFKFVCVTLSK